MKEEKIALNMKINPEVKYLAEIGSRYRQESLASFIEQAVKEALDPERFYADEPQATPMPLVNSGLWHEDEATRLFLLATAHPDLLSRSETKLWALLTGSLLKNEGKITLKNFRAYYDSPSINKSHLKEGTD